MRRGVYEDAARSTLNAVRPYARFQSARAASAGGGCAVRERKRNERGRLDSLIALERHAP